MRWLEASWAEIASPDRNINDKIKWRIAMRASGSQRIFYMVRPSASRGAKKRPMSRETDAPVHSVNAERVCGCERHCRFNLARERPGSRGTPPAPGSLLTGDGHPSQSR